MSPPDIRWIQRFDNFNDAVAGMIMAAVQTLYVPAFEAFERRFLDLEKEELA